jgi:T5SS/PEP-CTERM-associated repeat protein/autotransporter-associated beta strand protein
MHDSNNVGDLGVGYETTGGSLTVKDGVTVNSVNGWLGVQTGSSGSGTVTGAGSTWSNSGILYIGAAGTGTLNITNGGTVAVNTVIGGGSTTGVGTLNFDGGTLKSYNAANSAWITTGPGTMNVYVKGGGALFDTGGYNMGIGISLQHGGSNPTDGGLTKLGAGTLALSAANTYTGPTTVKAGTLELGPAAQSPVLTGAGANILAGSLIFDYSGPSPASTIQSLLAASYDAGAWDLGQFKTDTAAGLTLGWADDGSSKVTVMATLPGDASLDGSVNLGDLGILINNFGKPGTWATGDFNYDGTVNLSDLGTLINNFGQSAPVSSSVVIAGMGVRTVPEPGTLILLASGLLTALVHFWRKRK